MKIDGHYDRDADIVWLRFEGFDPATVVSEEAEGGLRDVDPTTGAVVGLEYWRASATLPAELLAMLPPPSVNVAAEPRSAPVSATRPLLARGPRRT